MPCCDDFLISSIRKKNHALNFLGENGFAEALGRAVPMNWIVKMRSSKIGNPTGFRFFPNENLIC